MVRLVRLLARDAAQKVYINSKTPAKIDLNSHKDSTDSPVDT